MHQLKVKPNNLIFTTLYAKYKENHKKQKKNILVSKNPSRNY